MGALHGGSGGLKFVRGVGEVRLLIKELLQLTHVSSAKPLIEETVAAFAGTCLYAEVRGRSVVTRGNLTLRALIQ